MSTAPSGAGPARCRGYMITLRHTTLGRTPLDEWSARRRDLYLTTYDNDKRQTCPRGDSNLPSLQASGPKTYALDRAVTGTEMAWSFYCKYQMVNWRTWMKLNPSNAALHFVKINCIRFCYFSTQTEINRRQYVLVTQGMLFIQLHTVGFPYIFLALLKFPFAGRSNRTA